jgi:hypothetical protein
MIDGDVEIRRSGPGLRASLPVDGEIVVSLWSAEQDTDLVATAHKANMGRMQIIDRHEHALAQEMAAQQWAEFLKIRARA